MNPNNIIKLVILSAACIVLSVSIHRCGDANDARKIEHTLSNHASDSCSSEAQYISIDMLEQSKSLYIKELDSLRKALRIRDSKLQWMTMHRSTIHLHDTVYIYNNDVYDTSLIGEIATLRIDTCITKGEWATLCISASPGYITTDVRIKTQPSIVAYSKKVPVGKPRRTWIGRLFQKKTTVVEAYVKEANPYAVVDTTVFVIPVNN